MASSISAGRKMVSDHQDRVSGECWEGLVSLAVRSADLTARWVRQLTIGALSVDWSSARNTGEGMQPQFNMNSASPSGEKMASVSQSSSPLAGAYEMVIDHLKVELGDWMDSYPPTSPNLLKAARLAEAIEYLEGMHTSIIIELNDAANMDGGYDPAY